MATNRLFFEIKNSELRLNRRLPALFLLGFFIMLAGFLVLIIVAALSGNSSVSFGGVVFIGPFPIVFGAGPDALTIIVLSITLAVLSIVTFIIMRKRMTQ